MATIIVLLLIVGVVTLTVRHRRRHSRTRAVSWRVRWACRLSPLLLELGWSPSFAIIAWAAVAQVLRCAVAGPSGRTRLASQFRVGLAVEDFDRLGAYLGEFAADVEDLVAAVVAERHWVQDGGVRIDVGVDETARSLTPTVVPERAADGQRRPGRPADQSGSQDPASRPVRPSRSQEQPSSGAGVGRDQRKTPSAYFSPTVPMEPPAEPTVPKTVTVARGTLDAGTARFDLGEGETIVGRGRGAGISLNDDTRVSRRHLAVRIDGAMVTVEDLGSANGSALNGQPLKVRSALCDGDVLTAGSTTLVFRDAETSAA